MKYYKRLSSSQRHIAPPTVPPRTSRYQQRIGLNCSTRSGALLTCVGPSARSRLIETVSQNHLAPTTRSTTSRSQRRHGRRFRNLRHQHSESGRPPATDSKGWCLSHFSTSAPTIECSGRRFVDRPTALEGAAECELIGVLQIAANGKSARNAGHVEPQWLE